MVNPQPNKQSLLRTILVDSDAFVGRMNPKDAHYQRASQLFQSLADQDARFITTNMVVAETATVLSHRVGQSLARTFLDVIEQSAIPIFYIDEELYQQAITLFKKQEKKGTSVTDCANVIVLRQFGLTEIFSFDKVYGKRFGVQPIVE